MWPYLHVVYGAIYLTDLINSFLERLASSEHGSITLHDLVKREQGKSQACEENAREKMFPLSTAIYS